MTFQDWGNERLERAQRQVELNQYDVDSWSLLIREAQSRSISEVRSLYEALVTAFPTTGRYWKMYIEQEVSIVVFIGVLFIAVYFHIFIFRFRLKLGILNE